MKKCKTIHVLTFLTYILLLILIAGIVTIIVVAFFARPPRKNVRVHLDLGSSRNCSDYNYNSYCEIDWFPVDPIKHGAFSDCDNPHSPPNCRAYINVTIPFYVDDIQLTTKRSIKGNIFNDCAGYMEVGCVNEIQNVDEKYDVLLCVEKNSILQLYVNWWMENDYMKKYCPLYLGLAGFTNNCKSETVLCK